VVEGLSRPYRCACRSCVGGAFAKWEKANTCSYPWGFGFVDWKKSVELSKAMRPESISVQSMRLRASWELYHIHFGLPPRLSLYYQRLCSMPFLSMSSVNHS
jgi:hypothetical protein